MKLSQLIFFFYLTLHSYYSNIKQTKIKLFYLSLKDLNDDILKIK